MASLEDRVSEEMEDREAETGHSICCWMHTQVCKHSCAECVFSKCRDTGLRWWEEQKEASLLLGRL